MRRRLTLAVSLLLLLAIQAMLAAQVPSTITMPKDAAALMTLAHEKNGLNSDNIRPWHIRGNYTFYDFDGKTEDTGVYEEWWFTPSQYKRSYTSANFKQTEYANSTGVYRDGSQDWPGGKEMLLRSNLIEPIPEGDILKQFKLEQHVDALGKGKVDCVVLGFPLRSNLIVGKDFFRADCFDASVPALRISTTGSTIRTGYNEIVSFQGHYLARQIFTTFQGKPMIDLKLDVIESLKETPDAVLAQPATALHFEMNEVVLKPVKGRIWPILLKETIPVYPVMAKSQKIQGTVVMQITIGKDGHVSNVQGTSGPELLQKSAIDGVRQYLYRPVTLMGDPIEVKTEIRMVFNLGS